MKRHAVACASLLCLFPVAALAECTYGEARSRSLEVTNLQATQGRERMAYLQKGEDLPAELEARVEALEADLKPLRDEFTAMLEPQALSIQDDSPIDPKFCRSFEALLAKHAPEAYESAPISLSAATPFACEGIDSTTLWQRYGEAMQAQTSLLQSGRIDQAQALALSQKFSQFGTEMSTAPTAACATLQDIERDVAAYGG